MAKSEYHHTSIRDYITILKQRTGTITMTTCIISWKKCLLLTRQKSNFLQKFLSQMDNFLSVRIIHTRWKSGVRHELRITMQSNNFVVTEYCELIQQQIVPLEEVWLDHCLNFFIFIRENRVQVFILYISQNCSTTKEFSWHKIVDSVWGLTPINLLRQQTLSLWGNIDWLKIITIVTKWVGARRARTALRIWRAICPSFNLKYQQSSINIDWAGLGGDRSLSIFVRPIWIADFPGENLQSILAALL